MIYNFIPFKNEEYLALPWELLIASETCIKYLGDLDWSKMKNHHTNKHMEFLAKRFWVLILSYKRKKLHLELCFQCLPCESLWNQTEENHGYTECRGYKLNRWTCNWNLVIRSDFNLACSDLMMKQQTMSNIIGLYTCKLSPSETLETTHYRVLAEIKEYRKPHCRTVKSTE